MPRGTLEGMLNRAVNSRALRSIGNGEREGHAKGTELPTKGDGAGNTSARRFPSRRGIETRAEAEEAA